MRRLQFLACSLLYVHTCTAADTPQVCALMLGLKIQIFQVAAGTPSIILETAATRDMVEADVTTFGPTLDTVLLKHGLRSQPAPEQPTLPFYNTLSHMFCYLTLRTHFQISLRM